MDKKRKITHEGEIKLGNTTIPCFVLEDGTRVLSSRRMQFALKIVENEDDRSSAKLQDFLRQKTLQMPEYKGKSIGDIKPFDCYKGNQRINGYEGTALADICDYMLEIRKHKILTGRQEIVANECEILMRGFARNGIIALIDEATGYQYDREKDELQKILSKYISEELLTWQKTFPDIYYRELFRLNGWDFTVNGIKKRPSIIGKWTNKLIYEQLPSGVLEELKQKTPKTENGNRIHRYHQFLTDDIGSPNLVAQINQIITLFKLSDNMEHMWELFERLKESQNEQSERPFDFDDKGRTIDTNESESEVK